MSLSKELIGQILLQLQEPSRVGVGPGLGYNLVNTITDNQQNMSQQNGRVDHAMTNQTCLPLKNRQGRSSSSFRRRSVGDWTRINTMRRRLSLSPSAFCFVVLLIILTLLHLCFYIYVFDYIEVILIILCKKPYYTVRLIFTFYTLKVWSFPSPKSFVSAQG